MKSILQDWNKRCNQLTLGYSDILHYYTDFSKIQCLAECFGESRNVVCLDTIKTLKDSFERKYEELAKILILEVSTDHGIECCNTFNLLKQYGIRIPTDVEVLISTKFFFPGEKIPGENKIVKASFFSEKPTFVNISDQLTLDELRTIYASTEKFIAPISPQDLDMLAYFKVNGSILFEKHLLQNLKIVKKNAPDDLSFDQLISAIEATDIRMEEILSEVATYNQIITEDEGMLQKLDIDKEYSILKQFKKYSVYPSTGLDGIKCMLELIQYTLHIDYIKKLCNQYETMAHYLYDEALVKLFEIAEKHDDCSQLNAKTAKQDHAILKNILHCNNPSSLKRLNIFQAVSNSVAFYKFLRENKFYGSEGKHNFLKQYELITAQLMHEEYNEQVLNHLRIGFKIMYPFLNPKISFFWLMDEIMKQDYTDEFSQLDTVNFNITLIRLWFSRAEVSKIITLWAVCNS